jgi:GntR family transcriptional regulator
MASGEVIGIHSVSLPLDLGRRLTEEDLLWGESSLDYIEGRLGLHISESFRTIEAVPANEREAELLGVELGSPMLLVQRTVLDRDGRRIEFLKAAYRGDRFEYYLHFNHDANHGVVHTKFEGPNGSDSKPSA